METLLFIPWPPYSSSSPPVSLTHKHARTNPFLPSPSQLLFIDYWHGELKLASDLCSSPTVALLGLSACASACLPVCLLGVRQEALQSLMKVMRKREGGGGGNINCENKYMQITYSIQVFVMDKRMRWFYFRKCCGLASAYETLCHNVKEKLYMIDSLSAHIFKHFCNSEWHSPENLQCDVCFS